MVAYSAGLLVSRSQTNLCACHLLIVLIIIKTIDKWVARKLATICESIIRQGIITWLTKLL